MGAEGVLVEREAVEGAADADGERARCSSGPSVGMVERCARAASTAARRRPGGRGSPPGCPRRRRAAPRGRHRRRCGPPPRRAPGSASRPRWRGPDGGRRETSSAEPVGDQTRRDRRTATSRPASGRARRPGRADRHPRRRRPPAPRSSDEGERLRGRGVVVVAVGDLTDPDDDRECARSDASMRVRSAHAVAPPSSTMMAPDM